MAFDVEGAEQFFPLFITLVQNVGVSMNDRSLNELLCDPHYVRTLPYRDALEHVVKLSGYGLVFREGTRFICNASCAHGEYRDERGRLWVDVALGIPTRPEPTHLRVFIEVREHEPFQDVFDVARVMADFYFPSKAGGGVRSQPWS